MDTQIKFSDLKFAKLENNFTDFIFKNEVIKVKFYLPIEDKIKLVSYILDKAVDENGITISPTKKRISFVVGFLNYYTNIDFTEKELNEDIYKTYDIIVTNNLFQDIWEKNLSSNEKIELTNFVEDTMTGYEKFASSFVGAMQMISNDANKMSNDLDNIMQQISNKEGIAELIDIKNIMGE